MASQSKSTWYTDTDAATITMDWNVSENHQVTLAGNRTLVFSNPVNGCVYRVKVTQDATGSRTLSYPSTVKWVGGSAPSLTATASRTDLLTFVWDGVSYLGTSNLNFTLP